MAAGLALVASPRGRTYSKVRRRGTASSSSFFPRLLEGRLGLAMQFSPIIYVRVVEKELEIRGAHQQFH